MTCECNNVTNYDGKHQCILCGRRFMPVEVCGKCDESKPEPQNKVSALREGLKNAGSWTIDKWISNYALSGKYNPDR